MVPSKECRHLQDFIKHLVGGRGKGEFMAGSRHFPWFDQYLGVWDIDVGFCQGNLSASRSQARRNHWSHAQPSQQADNAHQSGTLDLWERMTPQRQDGVNADPANNFIALTTSLTSIVRQPMQSSGVPSKRDIALYRPDHLLRSVCCVYSGHLSNAVSSIWSGS